MLYGLFTLVALQAAGDLIADLLSLPVPGMVIGLLLLLGYLNARGRLLGREAAVPDGLVRLAKGLHDHFGLLFVPAGAGVVANLGLFAKDGFGLLLTVLLSTVLTIAITAMVAARRAATRPVAAAEAAELG
jgi:holin-like protein